MRSYHPALWGLIILGWLPTVQAADLEYISSSSAMLDNPRDVRLSSDERFLFVSDGDNDRIVVLDPTSLELISHFGTGKLNGPQGLDVGPDNHLYVADSHNNRIVVYDVSDGLGELKDVLSGKLSKPFGVAVDDDGLVYVASAWSRNVVVYRNTEFLSELRDLGTPSDIEWTPKGELWIADRSRNELVLLSDDLTIRSRLDSRGRFITPHAIALTDRHNLAISEKYTHQVKILSPDGELLSVIGTGRPGDDANELRMPEGLEASADSLWIADSGNDRVVHYRLGGM